MTAKVHAGGPARVPSSCLELSPFWILLAFGSAGSDEPTNGRSPILSAFKTNLNISTKIFKIKFMSTPSLLVCGHMHDSI